MIVCRDCGQKNLAGVYCKKCGGDLFARPRRSERRQRILDGSLILK